MAAPPEDSPRMLTTLPLVDEVTSIIRERIYAGYYTSGEWLRQEQLSHELQISRTPLREALRKLEQEGLVKHESGRGTRIVSGDAHTLIAAYELRAAIDAVSAKLTAVEATAADVRSLRRIIEFQGRALNPWVPRTYTKLNVDFHEMIMVMTGNEFVIAQTSLLRMTGQVFAPVAQRGPRNAAQAISEHAEITDAIESQDEAWAERVAKNHIEQTIAEIRNTIASEPSS